MGDTCHFQGAHPRKEQLLFSEDGGGEGGGYFTIIIGLLVPFWDKSQTQKIILLKLSKYLFLSIFPYLLVSLNFQYSI